MEGDAYFHVDLFAGGEQAGDEFVEGDGHVFEIDEHVHDEQAADDVLLDVFDVDAALGEIGCEARDDALLVFAEILLFSEILPFSKILPFPELFFPDRVFFANWVFQWKDDSMGKA